MKSDELTRLNRDRLAVYLTKNGYRHTRERYTILEQACLLTQPFYMDELIAVAETMKISKATVYNTMTLLQEARLVHLLGKQYHQSGGAQYEVIGLKHNHMQIICSRCGRISEFRDVALTNLLKSRKYSNFYMQHFSLYVYGECKQCRKRI